jgi:hypothetical protein
VRPNKTTTTTTEEEEEEGEGKEQYFQCVARMEDMSVAPDVIRLLHRRALSDTGK